MSMEHWRNYTDGAKPKDSDKSLFHRLFFHQRSHIDCCGIELEPHVLPL